MDTMMVGFNVEIVALVMEIPALVVTVNPGKGITVKKVVVPPVQAAASKTKILVKTL